MTRRGRGVPPVPVRAVLAVGVVAGHHLLALAILAAVAGADVFLLRSGHVTPGTLEGLVGSVAIAWAVVRILLLTRRSAREEPPHGLVLTPDAQPRLWQRVREVAAQVGTPAPMELLLVPEVTAFVRQSGGPRRLYIGAPLLLGLAEGELDAVLAHEMGHYAGGDVRLAALVWAARERLQRTLIALRERDARQQQRDAGKSPGPDHYLAKVFTTYAHLCLRATQSVSRRQELAADRVAARIAGRGHMTAALRRLPALEAAHDVYLTHYALMGHAEGFAPPAGEVHAGFSRFLADDARRHQLAEVERDPSPEPTSPYDSHPPIVERIAVLEALGGAAGHGDMVRRPAAVALLCEPARVFAELEEAVPLVPAHSGTLRRVAWHELPLYVRHAAHGRAAQPLREAVRRVADPHGRPEWQLLLDLLDLRRWYDVAALLPKSEAATHSSGRASREFARTALRSALHHLSVLALVEAGHVSWELSWAGPPMRKVAPASIDEALESALERAMGEPSDTGALRALLSGCALPEGIDQPHENARPPHHGLTVLSSDGIAGLPPDIPAAHPPYGSAARSPDGSPAPQPPAPARPE
ncbi:M48 family metallopeptidase [Streptomyces canus]|uniref:M48 family metallopeptidase n=1 Tax=Streptomyces canus TaxID=58343 RepID=UPI00278B3DE7|nr:M48 family metallopeptidase [Streptomyces canus]MDQ1068711.1 Zn-dependent protease with chaperone function [Streptomyces canus]